MRRQHGAAADDVVASATGISSDLTYVGLLFALVVFPKVLQRFGIPGAITSLLLGVVASLTGVFSSNDTLHLLSTLGIVALFLFAGLEIDGPALRADAKLLFQHGAVWLAMTLGTVFAISKLLLFPWRVSLLFALALVTPSTGFILSSLHSFGLDAGERLSVKSKAVAAELLSLLLLFVALQSTSVAQMATATAALVAIVLIIPFAFRFFATTVAPYAPRSEFAFLLMVAVVCAFATRKLGVYYLVGAFAVGVAAQRFRTRLPAMSSEKMVDALEAFGSVFIPFYFFGAGLDVHAASMGWGALAAGLVMLAFFVPLRILATASHRRLSLGERYERGRRVAISLLPTLVFTLVLADMLRTRFGVADYLIGGLILYAIVTTTLPAFLLRMKPPEFESPVASDLPADALDDRPISAPSPHLS